MMLVRVLHAMILSWINYFAFGARSVSSQFQNLRQMQHLFEPFRQIV